MRYEKKGKKTTVLVPVALVDVIVRSRVAASLRVLVAQQQSPVRRSSSSLSGVVISCGAPKAWARFPDPLPLAVSSCWHVVAVNELPAVFTALLLLARLGF